MIDSQNKSNSGDSSKIKTNDIAKVENVARSRDSSVEKTLKVIDFRFLLL